MSQNMVLRQNAGRGWPWPFAWFLSWYPDDPAGSHFSVMIPRKRSWKSRIPALEGFLANEWNPQSIPVPGDRAAKHTAKQGFICQLRASFCPWPHLPYVTFQIICLIVSNFSSVSRWSAGCTWLSKEHCALGIASLILQWTKNEDSLSGFRDRSFQDFLSWALFLISSSRNRKQSSDHLTWQKVSSLALRLQTEGCNKRKSRYL